MTEELKEVDLTPTPKSYAQLLNYIVQASTREEDVIWAREELERIKPVLEKETWN